MNPGTFDRPDTVGLPTGPFTSPSNPAMPDITGTAADSLGFHGSAAPGTDGAMMFGAPAGASPRPDQGLAVQRGEGPQCGDINFQANGLAPDATPPSTYSGIVNQPPFNL